MVAVRSSDPDLGRKDLFKRCARSLRFAATEPTQRLLETDGLTVTKRTSTVIGVGTNPSQEIFSIGARETANVTQLQYRMGSLLVPQRPLKMSSGMTGNGAELSEQLLRIFGKLQSMGDDFGVVMTDKALFLKNDVNANNTQGTTILGCDLNASGGTLDDLANSGQNLLSTPVSPAITFDPTDKCAHDCRVTTFASFDQLLMLDMQTGLLSVRF